MILLQDWSGQNASSIASEICGFITVLSGTIILHSTREQESPPVGKNDQTLSILLPIRPLKF